MHANTIRDSFNWQELANKRNVRNLTRTTPSSQKTGEDHDHQRTVLLIGRIRELALYRAEVLERMGFEVIVPEGREETIQAIEKGGFQIAILSYTLSDNDVKDFSDLIRQQCPGCPLVTIAQQAKIDRHVMPDAVVMSERGPAGLVDALMTLLRQRPQ